MPVRFPSREQAAQVREALRRAGTSARGVLLAWAQGELVGAQEAARAAEEARREAARLVAEAEDEVGRLRREAMSGLEREATRLARALVAKEAKRLIAELQEKEIALDRRELQLALRERRLAEIIARLRGISANAALSVVREAVSAVSSDGVPAIVTKFLAADLLVHASASTCFRNTHKPSDVG
jgi:vacuolar-type H+-ATPase subunit I/STV1